MTTMESLIGLVNRIQQACTKLGDYGGSDNNTFSSLWEALPSVAVVGGQVTNVTKIFQTLNFFSNFCLFINLCVFGNDNRVPVSLRFWKVSLDVTFYLEDQVLSFSLLFFNYNYNLFIFVFFGVIYWLMLVNLFGWFR